MEIYDYLKGRWLVLLIVTPMLAGVLVAGLLTKGKATQYEAHGEVDVAQALSGSPDDFVVISRGPARADFRNDLASDATATSVSAALGVPVDEVRGKLQSTIISPEVSGVDVTFTAETKELAARGLETGSRAVLSQLAQQQLAIARRNADAANSQAAAANARQTALENSSHLVDIESQYRAVSSDVLNLQTLIANSTAAATTVKLQALLQQRQVEQGAYAKVLSQYVDRQAAKTKLDSSAQEAAAALGREQQVASTLRGANVVNSPRLIKAGSVKAILRPVAAGVIITFLLVLGVALLAMRRKRRKRSTRGTPDVNDFEFDLEEATANSRTTGATVP